MSLKVHAAQIVLVALLGLPNLALGQDDAAKTCSQQDWDEYFATIRNHVKSYWNPPPGSQAISCTVLLRQDFRSEVEHVEILSCGDDEKVQKSVEYAGYAASPLPIPKNKACFTRQMTIRLKFTPK